MKLIIDTDIGDDYDDIVTLAVALASPELDILGVTTVAGDSGLRARLTKRFLNLAGREDVPVAVGATVRTGAPFTHRRWARGGPELDGGEPQAVDFLLQQIAANPGQVTLLAIGPLTNLAEALQRDPATFRKLERIVLMGGSVRRGYRDMAWQGEGKPSIEYNILSDIKAAQAVFEAGVPLTVAPLDGTLVVLDEMKRQLIFTRSTPITDALALTYLQWSAVAGRPTPILFDTAALAFAIDPSMFKVERLRLVVDDEGYTREVEGPANAEVCLDCDEDAFQRWLMPRLVGRPARG
jgi:inosine-uridine nucleoside N-ribohydrolase